jgi:dienelactone hydrolase
MNLPATQLLTEKGDLAAMMVEGINRFLDRQIELAGSQRGSRWRRDYSSTAAYEDSVAGNRRRFLELTGTAWPRKPTDSVEVVAAAGQSALVARGPGFDVYAVRWASAGPDEEFPVEDCNPLVGCGLLAEPSREPIASVVVLPDADELPEQVMGIGTGRRGRSPGALLAEQGCRVVVPLLVDRKDTWSGSLATGNWTNQPHREFLWRIAYELGRHVAGLEMQLVFSLLDWFVSRAPTIPIGVMGYGEGGLVALYSAAADTRITSAAVSGYFGEREALWTEPIYRSFWGLLSEFGDSDIASLVAPRSLIVEAAAGPTVVDPTPRENRTGAAPGRLTGPAQAQAAREFDKARQHYAALGLADRAQLVAPDPAAGAWCDDTLRLFLGSLGKKQPRLDSSSQPLRDLRTGFDAAARSRRHFAGLCAYLESQQRLSAPRRDKLWASADTSSLERWAETTRPFRERFERDLVGVSPPADVLPNPRSRQLKDEATWRSYEVVLDVWRDVFACGILATPKDMQPGERRPVVVCQHGLEGRCAHSFDQERAYQFFAARLAAMGFVVYAPQNPYIGADLFRQIVRKGHPIRQTLYSVIVRQHEVTLRWLQQLPFVDPDRIAFYGISYGGKTAMRVVPLVEGYCASICSADFNDWVTKNVTITSPYSYMFKHEYDMYEFNLANTFGYAEMAALYAPRPFMVERGHDDIVAPDEWVAAEYAKVRRLYVKLGIPERTNIEFFDGGHQINLQGTLSFLRRHLNWAG